LREAVQSLRFSVQDQQVNLTISVGIAARHGLTASEALIGAADTALYAAKHAGRNRVKVAVSAS
jgi:diguanylate cyclase (GGDEF)-like protein